MTKYYENNFIGPYNTLFIKRLPNSYGIFKCSFCGKEFKAKISHIANGGIKSCGCQHYKLKYKEGDKIGPYKIKIVKRITEQYNYKGEFECPYCNNHFITQISSVLTGATKSCGCIHTYNLVGKKFGRLTPLEPTQKRQGSSIVWKCECDCGNIHYVSVNHLMQGKSKSCGQCNLKSIGEEKILIWLKQHDIIYETQKRFIDCRDKKPLPFDFYLPNYNICIEYDGLGHYKSNENSWRTAENVKLTQFHDSIKNEYCKKNNIKLIRIPYTEYNNIETILEKELL